MSRQSVKEVRVLGKKNTDFWYIKREFGKKPEETGVFPTPICQLFQIHGSIFQPDPSCNRSQTSVVRITHRVFFFRIGKDPFNRFLSERIQVFALFRLPDLLGKLQVFLPDMYA